MYDNFQKNLKKLCFEYTYEKDMKKNIDNDDTSILNQLKNEEFSINLILKNVALRDWFDSKKIYTMKQLFGFWSVKLDWLLSSKHFTLKEGSSLIKGGEKFSDHCYLFSELQLL